VSFRKLLPSVTAALVLVGGTVSIAGGLSVPPPTPVPVPCSFAGAPAAPSGSAGATPTKAPSPSPVGSGTCMSPSPFPTVLETPSPSRKLPDLRARAAILEDLDTGQVLFARRPGEERPLASTTKIMTALLVLSRLGPDHVVTIGPDAAEEGSAGTGFSELGLRLGEHISVRELLYGLMVQSSNDAAVALGDATSGTADAFVRAMNHRARALGLKHTVFFSPNGLDDRGHSTARELATITRDAMRIPLFAEVVRAKFHRIPSPSGIRIIQNRNVLLWLYPGAIGVKTGFTTAAGYCLVSAAERNGRRLVSVILGEPDQDTMFDDSAALLSYGFKGFREVALTNRGQAFGPLPVGTQSLRVQAAAGLERLLPAGSENRVKHKIEIRPGLHLPLEAGTSVGSVRFVLDGRALGSVTLRASAEPSASPPSPSSEPPSDGWPWWMRGTSTVVRFSAHAFWSLFG
jgi:serine-type D-Ala-D-Ala carboxypeptidase (penicillin-binding protein 5/6)